jgi:holo-[acyl-carrier protein] synthase
MGERILSHGIDLVEVARIERLLEEHGERFLARIFTPGEVAYADANPGRRGEHLAARFAAKEAVMKALGTGWARGVAFADIEVVRDGAGKPSVELHAGAAALASEMGITKWLLSLTHSGLWAQASAIAIAPADE